MATETNAPAALHLDTATSARLGRETASLLHGGEFGFVLGPIFRTEKHALHHGRHDFNLTPGYARGGFDKGAFLDAFRSALAALGGWATAAPLV